MMQRALIAFIEGNGSREQKKSAYRSKRFFNVGTSRRTRTATPEGNGF